MLTIDGSTLEGVSLKFIIQFTSLFSLSNNQRLYTLQGGQIIRIAICLSALLKKPIKLIKIRAGRPKGGLAAQHLKGIELVKAICNAKVNGAAMGSTEVEFAPGNLRGGEYSADTATAG